MSRFVVKKKAATKAREGINVGSKTILKTISVAIVTFCCQHFVFVVVQFDSHSPASLAFSKPSRLASASKRIHSSTYLFCNINILSKESNNMFCIFDHLFLYFFRYVVKAFKDL